MDWAAFAENGHIMGEEEEEGEEMKGGINKYARYTSSEEFPDYSTAFAETKPNDWGGGVAFYAWP